MYPAAGPALCSIRPLSESSAMNHPCRAQTPSPTFRRGLLMAALAGAGLLGAAAAQAADPTVPRQIVVKLLRGDSLPAVLSTHGLTLARRLGPRPLYLLRTKLTDDTAAKIAELNADPRVAFAEPNVRVRDPEARKRSVWAIGRQSDYQAQWAPAQLGLAAAHAVNDGSGITVAVIDTGVDFSHPALAGRLRPGFDYVDNDHDPSERGSTADAAFGHGTHVAGLVALAAPGAAILPLRVLDPAGRGTIWNVAEALLYAADPDGNPATADHAQVINLSLGTTTPTRLLDKVVELVTCSDDDDDEDDDDYSDPGFNGDRERCDLHYGSVVTAAAGNGGNARERQYPAAERAEGALSVAASTELSRVATFSNRGSWVMIAAPGEGLTSTVPGGGYGVWSGTSMAAPLAAGVAALLRAQQPDWKPVDVTKRLQDRSARLCGSWLRRIDARGALLDENPGPTSCL